MHEWIGLREIVNLYAGSTNSCRNRLKKALDQMSATEKGEMHRPGKGRQGDVYSQALVVEVFGEAPAGRLTPAQMEVFRGKRLAHIKAIGERPEDLPTGVLASRKVGYTEYITLANEMMGTGKGLRIRCITGTDYFNSHLPPGGFLRARSKKHHGDIRVQLTYPFGHGARIRSAAEGDRDLDASQFSRDARSTFKFITDYYKRVGLQVRWIEDLPPSLLIWTQEYALIELYDYGPEDKDQTGCIGRKAPIMVIDSSAPYHTILKNSFDYIFEGDPSETHVKVYKKAQVAEEYRKRSRR
jgi:hypothetical protein